MLLHLYPDIDPAYALTTDLSQPLLFAPIGDKVRLIDGSHRVLKALFLQDRRTSRLLPDAGGERGQPHRPPARHCRQ